MNNRINTIKSEMLKALSTIISQDLRNPKITGIISVTSVETTSDLDVAKVYISIFTTGDKMDVFNEVKHSAGYIRQELSHKIDLRKTPYLQFYLDESAEYGAKIDKKIQEIEKGRK